jgi:hypothetical protein
MRKARKLAQMMVGHRATRRQWERSSVIVIRNKAIAASVLGLWSRVLLADATRPQRCDALKVDHAR